MPVRHFFKPGSWNRICDQTGFAVRAENTRKQWNNLIVRTQSFEYRNPQDFVRGVRDEQNAPDPRPRSPFVFEGGSTTLSANAAIRATTLLLTAPIGLINGNIVSIMLDSGNVFLGTVVSMTGLTLVVSQPIPAKASAGNVVVNTDFIAVQQQNYPRAS